MCAECDPNRQPRTIAELEAEAAEEISVGVRRSQIGYGPAPFELLTDR